MLNWPLYLTMMLQESPAEGQASGSAWFPVVIILPMVLLFWLMVLRPGQKQKKEREKMLGDLRKNDHVVTIGGIKGVVANVRLEEDEVVLRVDEATGAKLRVARSSIARVIRDDSAAAKDS